MTSSSVEPRADAAPPVPSDAPADAADEVSAHEHDILTTAEGSNRLGVFVDFMRAAGLAAVLLEAGPFTVFAPTDRAFSKMSVRERDALLADRLRLRQVMRAHVVAGTMAPPSVAEPSSGTTLDGGAISLTWTNGAYRVGNARLVQTSIPASNGTIHAIDTVLLSS